VAPLEVSVHSDRTLWLQDGATGGAERKVGYDELVAAIQQKQSDNPEQAVVIAADKDVRYEAVLEVMDTLQKNQVKKVGLLAKPRSP
jgi:biopolymer transport protein TolR